MEIKIDSTNFEQGKLEPYASAGSDYETRVKDPSSHPLHGRRVRSKELISCSSDRKVTFSGNNSRLMIWVLEFDKNKKYLGLGEGWNYFTDHTLKFETAYVAFMIARNPNSALLDVSLLGSLSLIPYHDDWAGIGVDMYRGQLSTWATKPYSDWGIKAGDIVTFQVRIKSTSGKKLRARIEWFNSGNDRVSTYPESIQVIENGEGVSTVTQTVPAQYSQMGLWLDANLTTATHTDITTELVKADVFVIGSSVPSNLDRGGVLIMNDYPTLPIVTTPDGFEYAEGYNILSVSKALLEEIGNDRSAFITSKVVSDGGFDLTVTKDTTSLANVRFQWINLPYALTRYRLTFETWAELPTGASNVQILRDICDANAQGFTVPTTRTKFTGVHIPSPTYIFDNVYRGFIDFEIRRIGSVLKAGTKIHVRNIMLTLGQTEFDYRPNPADLVGGGCL